MSENKTERRARTNKTGVVFPILKGTAVAVVVMLSLVLLLSAGILRGVCAFSNPCVPLCICAGISSFAGSRIAVRACAGSSFIASGLTGVFILLVLCILHVVGNGQFLLCASFAGILMIVLAGCGAASLTGQKKRARRKR